MYGTQKPYLYQKEFALLSNGNILLKNPQILLKYIAEKVQDLEKNYHTGNELNIKLTILNEFFEMYEYDYENAKFPEPFGVFENQQKKEEFKKKSLLLNEMVLSLGNIYTNFHTNIAKKKMPIPIYDIPNFIVNYNELYNKTINEYFSTLLGIQPNEIVNTKLSQNGKEKIDEEVMELVDVEYRGIVSRTAIPIEDKNIIPEKTLHSYGASYILPSLIESFLALKLQSKMIHMCLEKIQELENQGKVELEIEEKNICDCFNLNEEKSRIFLNDKTQMLTALYNVFTKYKVIEKNKYNEIILVQSSDYGRKPITLGSILNENNNFVKQNIKPEYLKLLSSLFDAQKLNIRNNIMHCNNASFDYFNIGITSIMLQLFWDIMSNEILI